MTPTPPLSAREARVVGLLNWLVPAASDARVRARFAIYRHHLGDYMLRYIVQTPLGTLRLHGIRRSDADRHLHDHPWDFASLLLTGSYVEEVPHPHGLRWRGEPVPRLVRRRRWSLVRHRAEDLHRLIVRSPVWTLVLTGPRRRGWGFATERGWVAWRTYLGVPPDDAVSRGAR